MLNGINPDGTAGWSQIAGYVAGTAAVVLIIAVGAGVVLAIWGKAWFSPGAIKKGWAMVALSAVGAMVLGGASAGAGWGTGLGTSELMPAGARPQAVSVEKQAPKQTCNRQAVRDFVDEDPAPDQAARERVISTVLGRIPAEAELDGYDWGQAPGDMDSSRQVITTAKWYADAVVTGNGEPDCSAENETTAACSPVEIHIATQSMTNGAQTGRTFTLTRSTNCS